MVSIYTQPEALLQALVSVLLASWWETRSFCNNFWNLHAFLNSYTPFPVTTLKRLMDQVARQGKMKSCFYLLCLGWLAVYSWLNASTSVFSKIWLLYTFESTPWLVAQTSREVFRIWKNRLKAKYISGFNYQYTVFCVTFKIVFQWICISLARI